MLTLERESWYMGAGLILVGFLGELQRHRAPLIRFCKSFQLVEYTTTSILMNCTTRSASLKEGAMDTVTSLAPREARGRSD